MASRSPRPMSRRDWFRGGGSGPGSGAGRGSGRGGLPVPPSESPAAGGAASRPETGSSAAGVELLTARRDAMGSFFEVKLSPRVPGAADLAARALDVVEDLEARLTVYREDSEISRLNALGARGEVELSPETVEVLTLAFRVGAETGGAYDVTAGALSEVWGFFRGPRRVPTPEALAEARARVGFQRVTLDPARRVARFDREGIRINLGSVGKGYAIDRAAELVRRHWWPTGALIHGGRSSLYALGSPPGRFGGRWPIGLHNPFDPDRPLGTLFLRNRGLGTSGATYQHFEVDGQRLGHILDPRTGRPIPPDGPASLTVIAANAAEADAYSTAFSVLSPREAAAVARARPELSILALEPEPIPAPGVDGGLAWRVRTFALGPFDFDPAPWTRIEPWV